MKDYTTSPKPERCIHINQEEHLRGVGRNMGFILFSYIKIAMNLAIMNLNLWKEVFSFSYTEFDEI